MLIKRLNAEKYTRIFGLEHSNNPLDRASSWITKQASNCGKLQRSQKHSDSFENVEIKKN